MPKRTDLKSILLIGSGPIVIGQACEFDYSGTQAVKALKEEGYRVILVNSNPATIMTDQNFADQTYIEPITAEFVERIIAKERPDALLPTIGGQTALNVTLELDEAGVFEKYGVELIGAKVEAIKAAEDRDAFKEIASRVGLESAKSFLVRSVSEAKEAVQKLSYPFIIRPSRTLGGSGGGIVNDPSEFDVKIRRGFDATPNSELLLEESLVGWKEIELEVMRDTANNAVIICGIENIDPMGVHTGDSITVAPIQTLTDKEYQLLRDKAIRLVGEIGVDTGGSNVQFAIDPNTGRQIVIEMNPRVSRSSALASKATGFPIAKIAAKLAVGYRLDELPNDITKMTPASFEPSIDYVVVKIPRFTFEKFSSADPILGTQMKSVGEAMAIGRTFPEALQKACRSLETGRDGLLGGKERNQENLSQLLNSLSIPVEGRLFLAARALELGASIEEVFNKTAFDPWFLREIKKIVDAESAIKGRTLKNLSKDELLALKRIGASDNRLSVLLGCDQSEVRALRTSLGIRPCFKTVDTCAAEFASSTPYLYSTYEDSSDVPPSSKRKIVILGGGPNRIGQGLEFDYCCVHASMALKDAGIESIMINCNPETVSTDYDTSDRLYFEPLTLEDVLEIIDRECPSGVIVQYGGQTPLKLSMALERAGVKVIGTSPESIEQSEDRRLFSALIDSLSLKQAPSGTAKSRDEAFGVAGIIGYPLVIRPSFVLGGRAMAIIHNDEELEKYVSESVFVSEDRPVLLDRFIDDAIELDVDAISDGKDHIVCGIVEHIERAGIHSGDSSFMLPSQTLSDEILAQIENDTKKLLVACGVRGLMNVQYAVRKGEVFVLEVNPRASRSVPFISKITGVPWAKVAARVMAGENIQSLAENGLYGPVNCFRNYCKADSLLPYVAVKQSVFPFIKFPGTDAVLGPEMKSTGEVMGIDITASGGFSRAQKASSASLPLFGKVFISVKDQDKDEILPIASMLSESGFSILATRGTARFLSKNGIKVNEINKVMEGSPHIVDSLQDGKIAMVINTPEGSGPLLDSLSIRSTAIQMKVPLFTTIAAAEAAVNAIKSEQMEEVLEVCTIQDYINSFHKALVNS
ncbi:MAG TPA: carbamoyl-phosphate synthase large subunit [Oligoflexia bacterium]|nr:carbamoyl-phosphate synthase large subunit [Oligoflexia bacterium]HMP47543.1 carbamoyl-phosphate synthase large subunit [Oligoflexia bacterium]